MEKKRKYSFVIQINKSYSSIEVSAFDNTSPYSIGLIAR